MTSRLHGIPELLRFLSTLPRPQDVARVLHTSTFGPLGARTCTLWAMDGDDLVAIGQSGHTDEEAERYRILPGALDLIMWRTIRSGVPLITDERDRVQSSFASIDEEFWAKTLAGHDVVSIVRAPITYAGRPVGALGILLDRSWPGDPSTRDLLETVRSVLGLWMTSPASGVRDQTDESRTRVGVLSLSFTDRQRRILRMVEQDASTARIAAAERISESSVKQDLQQVMRALNTRNRNLAAARARELGLL